MQENTRLSLGHGQIFITANLGIFSSRVPVGTNASEDSLKLEPPRQVFSFPVNSKQEVADLSQYFVPGTDCQVSDWRRVGTCSKSCDGGLAPEKKEILVAPSHNGLPCPKELVRQVDCFT